MYLLNVHTLKLSDFKAKPPPYAILSHTWYEDEEEISFEDLTNGNIDDPVKVKGREKLDGCIAATKEARFEWVWIDTCCINKLNAVQLSEAITSMFRWYRQAAICFVYLSDVWQVGDPTKPDSEFSKSRWFDRGWTLQELLAPHDLYFYTRSWDKIATKQELHETIETITGIPEDIVRDSSNMEQYTSVAQRMSWAAGRVTKREEDCAYCLFGLFGVNLNPRYGEGLREAFIRLQTALLLKDRDDSVFAWGLTFQDGHSGGTTQSDSIWASSPSDFKNCSNIVSHRGDLGLSGSNPIISEGLLTLCVSTIEHCGTTYALLNCGPEGATDWYVSMPLASSAGLNDGSSKWLFRPGNRPSIVLQVTQPLLKREKIQVLPNKAAMIDLGVPRAWVDIASYTTSHKLKDKYPPESWKGSSAKMPRMSELDPSESGTKWFIARFQLADETATKMLLVVIEINVLHGVGKETVDCHLMVVSALTQLADIHKDLAYMRPQAFGRDSIHFGNLVTTVNIKKSKKASFVISLTTMSSVDIHHPVGQIGPVDADFEIAHVEKKRQFVSKLSTKDNLVRRDMVERTKAAAKYSALHRIQSTLRDVENQIRSLEKQRQTLAKEAAQISHEAQLAGLEASRAEARLETAEQDIQLEAAMISSLERAQNDGLQNWLDSAVAALHGGAVSRQKLPGCPSLDINRGTTPTTSPSSNGQYSDSRSSQDGQWCIIPRQLHIEASVPITDLVGHASNMGQASDTDPLIERIVCPASHGPVIKAIYHGRYTEACLLKAHCASSSRLSSAAKGWLLTHTVRGGNELMTNLLIGWACSIDVRDAGQYTALMHSVERNDLSMVRLLLENGANVDADRGCPAQFYMLPHAIEKSWVAVAQTLIDNGTDLNNYPHAPCTPLTAAVKNGNFALTKLLLDKGALPSMPDSAGNLPIGHAVAANDTQLVRLLLSRGSPNQAPFIGQGKCTHSLAGLAASWGSSDILTLLLKDAPKYAEMEDQLSPAPDTSAIICAAQVGSSEALDVLVNGNFKLTTEAKDGSTALICAAENGHHQMVRHILATYQSQQLDRHAFNYAAKTNNMRVVNVLDDCGAVPEQRTFHDDPIKVAEKHGNSEMGVFLKNICQRRAQK